MKPLLLVQSPELHVTSCKRFVCQSRRKSILLTLPVGGKVSTTAKKVEIKNLYVLYCIGTQLKQKLTEHRKQVKRVATHYHITHKRHLNLFWYTRHTPSYRKVLWRNQYNRFKPLIWKAYTLIHLSRTKKRLQIMILVPILSVHLNRLLIMFTLTVRLFVMVELGVLEATPVSYENALRLALCGCALDREVGIHLMAAYLFNFMQTRGMWINIFLFRHIQYYIQ